MVWYVMLCKILASLYLGTYIIQQIRVSLGIDAASMRDTTMMHAVAAHGLGCMRSETTIYPVGRSLGEGFISRAHFTTQLPCEHLHMQGNQV